MKAKITDKKYKKNPTNHPRARVHNGYKNMIIFYLIKLRGQKRLFPIEKKCLAAKVEFCLSKIIPSSPIEKFFDPKKFLKTLKKVFSLEGHWGV